MNASAQDDPDQTGKAQALDDGLSFAQAWATMRAHLALLTFGPLLAAALAVGVSFLITPTFTAVTTILPPQQSQSAAASALASLGSLAGLANGSIGARNTSDQFVGLMQSVTVSNRLIEKFNLRQVYDVDYMVEARKEFSRRVQITLGKKDGLISVAVDDDSPQRAAEIANQFVIEMRRLTDTLAVTEAQQRRMFFEQQLSQGRDRLVKAQQSLQASGFNAGALKAEPRAAAEAFARLKAEATAAEVRLQTLRGSFADGTPEVRQQQALLAALRGQLERAELPAETGAGADYIGKYREYKYQETLFELYARQFELARIDESREGALIQVVDVATPPEKRSRPRRSLFAGVAAGLTGLVLLAWLLWRADQARPAPARPTWTAPA